MSLIDGYTAANHLKKRLIETAINNVGIMAIADDVYREMAKNRIDVWIDEIPTVDAVEVIKCKDCKYGKYDIADRGKYCGRNCVVLDTYESDYCSYAERRQDETD